MAKFAMVKVYDKICKDISFTAFIDIDSILKVYVNQVNQFYNVILDFKIDKPSILIGSFTDLEEAEKMLRETIEYFEYKANVSTM